MPDYVLALDKIQDRDLSASIDLNRFIRQVSSLNIIMKNYYNKILYSEAVKSNNDNINEDIEKIKKMMK